MRGNCALGRGQTVMVVVVVVVVVLVVKGEIFCLRLKACREIRGIAPFITILDTRWSFGVSIATFYGLEGPGIESRWVDIFRSRPDRPSGPPNLLYNGHRVFIPG